VINIQKALRANNSE